MSEKKQPQTPPAPKRSAAARVLKFIIIFTLLIVAVTAAYIWFTLNWSYENGERAGYLQKFSNKGWICKTWEGELETVALPGATPEKFYFTVRDEAVVSKVRDAVGKHTDLTFERHRGVVSSCFGDTQFYVTDVRIIEH